MLLLLSLPAADEGAGAMRGPNELLVAYCLLTHHRSIIDLMTARKQTMEDRDTEEGEESPTD